jgi:DNA-binding NtrC family response regulator
LDINDSNNNCVLIVDDESDILNVIQRGLLMYGFKVCTFTNSLTALEHFNSNSQEHHIVISDIRMPGMNGYEFVKQVKKINPEVKIILMSSFGMENKEFSNTLPDVKVDAFIKKPFSFQSLINIVQQELSCN